ncbi:MAG: AlkZ family DNA glycosylase [Actinobacteria bacterium]|nr:AlkZ family DNA glycosylase [Actinomycetota bacterium]
MAVYSLDQVNAFIAKKQCLTNDSEPADIVRIAHNICGLHSTSPTVPYISLFCRMNGNLKKEDFEKELYDRRSVAKIRSMRKTVYTFPIDMLPAVFNATRELVRNNFERYMQANGLTKSWCEKQSREILKVLSGSSMTTSQIKAVMKTTENINPVINAMCDECILIRGRPKGSWKSNTHHYSIFKEYLPGVRMDGVPVGEARKLVLNWYLAALGPSTEKDMSWWSGLTVGQVGKALKESGTSVTWVRVEGYDEKLAMLSSEIGKLEGSGKSGSGTVRLLPYLDSCVMGHKDRRRYIDDKHYDYVFDRSGNATYSITWNGRIVGVWDASAEKERVIKVLLFGQLPRYVIKKTSSLARKLGRFITGDEVQVLFCDSMVPLPRRTAGGFMSPLKLSGTRFI